MFNSSAILCTSQRRVTVFDVHNTAETARCAAFHGVKLRSVHHTAESKSKISLENTSSGKRKDMTYRYICKVGLYFVTEHLVETKTKFELRGSIHEKLRVENLVADWPKL